jgi:acetyltransferase-like isoleucine patch superfamily enzyme
MHGKNNVIIGFNKSIVHKIKIKIHGNNNMINLSSMSHLENCTIIINGNDNILFFGEKVYAVDSEFVFEDDLNELSIGDFTTIHGHIHIAIIEGKRVIIGNDCMLSSDITMRTGDSHSIINSDEKRINHSKDIIIGEHVWIGNKAILLKGTTIGFNSVVGSGAVVTKSFKQNNIIIAGNPANMIKTDINWVREKI